MQQRVAHTDAPDGGRFDGTQAVRLAQPMEPSCAVSYYGSGVAELLDDMHTITCPTMLHFGDADPYINHLAPHFSQPEAARKARTETAMFLFTHLGPNGAGA